MKKSAPLFLVIAASVLAASAIDRPAASTPAPAPKPVPSIPQTANTKPSLPQKQNISPEQVWMGIVPMAVPPALVAQLELNGNAGILIRSVGPNSPARKAGLKMYDVLLQINETPIRNAQDIAKAIADSKPGDSANVELIRGAKKQTVKVPLEKRPDNMPKIDGIMSADEQANDPNDEALASQLKTRIIPLLKSQKLGSNNADLNRKLQDLQKKLSHGSSSFEDEMSNMDEHMQRFMQPLLKKGIPQIRSHMSQLQELLNAVEDDMDTPPSLPSFTNSSSSMMMNISDGKGTVTVNKVNGSTNVSVTDNNGTVLYQGPYNTDKEKEAVPANVRARLDEVISPNPSANNGQL